MGVAVASRVAAIPRQDLRKGAGLRSASRRKLGKCLGQPWAAIDVCFRGRFRSADDPSRTRPAGVRRGRHRPRRPAPVARRPRTTARAEGFRRPVPARRRAGAGVHPRSDPRRGLGPPPRHPRRAQPHHDPAAPGARRGCAAPAPVAYRARGRLPLRAVRGCRPRRCAGRGIAGRARRCGGDRADRVAGPDGSAWPDWRRRRWPRCSGSACVPRHRRRLHRPRRTPRKRQSSRRWW